MDEFLNQLYIKRFCLPVNKEKTTAGNTRDSLSTFRGFNHISCILKGKDRTPPYIKLWYQYRKSTFILAKYTCRSIRNKEFASFQKKASLFQTRTSQFIRSTFF